MQSRLSISARVFAGVAATALLAACGSESDVPAAGETEEVAPEASVIEQRQELLEGIGDEFKAIFGQLETGAPDLAVIGEAAKTINANATELDGMFPEGTGMDSGADTEALATIWEKPDEFAAAHDALVEKSAALQAAAESGDAAATKAAVDDLGKACKACHDQFRKKKED